MPPSSGTLPRRQAGRVWICVRSSGSSLQRPSPWYLSAEVEHVPGKSLDPVLREVDVFRLGAYANSDLTRRHRPSPISSPDASANVISWSNQSESSASFAENRRLFRN